MVKNFRYEDFFNVRPLTFRNTAAFVMVFEIIVLLFDIKLVITSLNI